MTNGMNQEKQQKLNRSLVIDLLRQEGICSRADLSKLTKLKRATITNIINEFIHYGFVVEDGILEGKKGRRSIGIRINGNQYQVIGVMVTRKYYCIVLMGINGQIFEVKKFDINEKMDTVHIIEKMKQDIRQMIKENKSGKVLAVAVALPGPYRQEKGELVFLTNLIGWEGVPVRKQLQESFDIPIFVENDANAGAYAQLWFHGKKSELQNLIYIVAGQGIGCGMVCGGKILYGSMGLAGEIGHTSINFDGPVCECGNRGCLETYCCVIALERNIRQKIRCGESSILKENFQYEQLAQAIQLGDFLAVKEYQRVCEYLAVGIVNVINQMNPGCIIIGDQLAELAPKMMLDIIQATVKKTIRPLIWESISIEINTLKHNPIMIGAGAIAAQKVFENPIQYL